MPCVQISTNVCLDGVDTDPIFSEATKVVSQIIGRPEEFVMVILKGSVPISFERNKEPAAYAEIISMGGITSEKRHKLVTNAFKNRYHPHNNSPRIEDMKRKTDLMSSNYVQVKWRTQE
uniref:Macrophage migration inhibitory factor homolog n=1 Tax=Tanacetum cinerariifolium TaxID=118510 RepID=A0A699H5G2_TANCI|nr:macrophage migration inhibitory factor homolog [Tanacetum cinerariifolium]